MATILKPIPSRSNLPFDPDHPVPKGHTLNPADLRAKYYKVIDPNAKFYLGDPRLQRDRTREIDPRRTVLFKKIRADPQEIFEATRRYVVDEIFRGRWYDRSHKEEVVKQPNMEVLKTKHRYKHDHDMFSILANKFGNEFKGWEPPEKKDFITRNKVWAGKKPENFSVYDRAARTMYDSHRLAIRQAQALKKSLQKGSSATSENGVSKESSTAFDQGPAQNNHNHHQRDQESGNRDPALSYNISDDTQQENRPNTAQYVNSLPMPPLPGEVPPIERRKKGVYPLHWKPRPQVIELRNRLFEVLSRKHAELKNSFRRFDEDHRGTVDLSELYRVMVEESGIACTRAELEELWDFFDRDRDGLVKYSDYAKTMGDDALDERDYFQIAHRRAAGKYNEEVRFFENEEQQENAHFMNKTVTNMSNDEEANLRRILFYEEIEAKPHNSLFTLKDKKFGAHFNEVHKKPYGTIENTNTHKLRLLFAQKVMEKYNRNVKAIFDKIETAEPGFLNLFQFSRIMKELGIEADDMTTNWLFQAFDKNFDGLLDADDLVECCNVATDNGDEKSNSNHRNAKDITFINVQKQDLDSSSRNSKVPLNKRQRQRQGNSPASDRSKVMQQLLLQKHRVSNDERANPRPQNTDSDHEKRPVSALSTAGGFQFASHASPDLLYQRAATPLQQLRESSKQFSAVTEGLPPRPSSTPPIIQKAAWQNINVETRQAQSAAPMPPKLSGPLFASTGQKGRPAASAASAATTNKMGAALLAKPRAATAAPADYDDERTAPPKMRPISSGGLVL